jgi:hypothetical protein
MNAMRRGAMAVALSCAVLGGLASALAAAELSEDDQKIIGELLGPDVLGAAVTAEPLTEKHAGLQDGTWTYQIVSGKNKGKSEQHVFKQMKRDASGGSWRYAAGPKDLLFLRAGEDGSLLVISEHDTDEGVVVKYSPGDLLVVNNLKAGESKKSKIDVKVYDLTDTDDVKHSGSLDLTFDYLGAYKVTVPAGTYDAALIKWTFKGDIGVASIEDTQYRFVAPDVGIVASIDKKDISALLVYQDHSKTGMVLQKAP